VDTFFALNKVDITGVRKEKTKPNPVGRCCGGITGIS